MKKFLSIFLLLLLLVFCTACKENEENKGNKGTEVSSASGSETNSEKPDDPALSGKILLSGENRYRIIYSSDNKKIGLKISDKLVSLDPNSSQSIGYYQICKDTSIADDGSPEILVGITNRTASVEAAKELPTYLDYSISVKGNKIAITANTEQRLWEAVNAFVSLIKKQDGTNGVNVVYEGDNLILDEYDGYAHKDLSIDGTPIKDFSIILPQSPTAEETETANKIKEWILNDTGINLAIRDDGTAEGDSEIIIGKTLRNESSAFTNGELSLAENSYSIQMVNGRIALAAVSQTGYAKLFSALKTEIIKNNLKDGTNILNTENVRSLDGKNILVCGNSFIYYGYCVIEGNQKNLDYGYLYEIFKRNGDNVNVYDFVWGGRNLNWIYENELKNADANLLKSIDIVIMSEAGENNENLIGIIKKIMALFEADTEFYYLNHAYTYQANHNHIKNTLPKLVDMGIPVADWGRIAYDLWTGAVKIPGSTINYNKDCFIVNKKDQHHQNMLSGYITAQMAYCLMTGASAVGQEYEFCFDPSVKPNYDMTNYINKYYNTGTTSMDKIFKSPTDMLGIQKLIDEYIREDNYN